MIRMVPAPRNTGETTKVETYIMTPATSAAWLVRVQLYYNSADTDKNVLAVITDVLTTSAATGSMANSGIYASSYTQTGSTVVLKSWDNYDSLTFTRGAAGTGSFPCSINGARNLIGGCESATSIALTYDAPTTTTLE